MKKEHMHPTPTEKGKFLKYVQSKANGSQKTEDPSVFRSGRTE